MRISGNEHSSVILRQKKVVSKLEKKYGPKVPKQAESKRGGVINPQSYNFNHFNTGNYDVFKTLRSNLSRS